MAEEKTEKPTEQKKKKARSEGTIARTPELGAWGGMLLATMTLPTVVGNVFHRAEALFIRCTGIIANPDPDTAFKMLRGSVMDVALAVAPLSLGLFVFAILAAAAQGGLRPASKLFKPNFKRLNPFSGLKKIAGPQALWEGAKALIKVGVIGAVVYFILRNVLPQLLSSATMPLQVLLDSVTGALIAILRAAAGAGLVLAFADYAMARRRTNKQLRMSKQEVKEEHRRSEGDPHIKGAIRQRQFEMARRRMMADLAQADVVLVNPTHVAITRGAPLAGS